MEIDLRREQTYGRYGGGEARYRGDTVIFPCFPKISLHVIYIKNVRKKPMPVLKIKPRVFFFSFSILQVRMFNDRLMQLNRAFINKEGLPGRPSIR